MNLDQNIKDNLTLMGSRDESRRLKPLLALLAAAILATVAFYAYLTLKRPARGDRTEGPKSVAISAKMDQLMVIGIKEMIASNNVALAREKCYGLLQNTTNAAITAETEKMLGRINMALLFSPAAMPEKKEYVVQSGDTLENLAKRHGTTVEMIRKCNSLQGKMIHPGDRLRIFSAKLNMDVSKGGNNLLLKADNRFFKRYVAGTGKFGTTPVGTFVIADKIAQPPWWRPDGKMVPYGDKENVLGTRWLSLAATGATAKVRGYGIHGTWEPETVGKQASAGCIRMHNADVEELFAIVPVGTPVAISE